jgi:signal transduction histidine kinase
LLLVVALAVIWLVAFRELAAGRAGALADARRGAELQAQVFAEYGRGQILQADQALLDLRELWAVDPGGFPERVRRRLDALDGLIVRVVAVDARGEVVHDSLAGAGGGTVPGFFRTPASERLHIGRPRPGESPDGWLFPLSRPLPGGGALFAWVSPERFAGYGKGLLPGELAAASVVADSGEVMARHPDGVKAVGRRIDNVPFLAPDAPLSGHFRRVAQTDGVERIYGYQRLPDYGMNFVIGYELGEVLAPQEAEQRVVLAIATGFSLAALALALAFHRIRRARLRSEARLAEGRAMLNSAIDTIGEGFVIYDGEDRLAYCNEQYRAYYPTSADLLVPGNSYEHIIRAAAARGQFKDAVGRIDDWVAERLAKHRGGRCDFVEALDDGRWVRIRERRTADGFIVGFRMDITELCVAREQAEAASRAKSDFLSSMSHELRTPLNAILGMSELCLMTRLDAQQGNYVTKIRRAADHLLGVINDTLDLSRIEAGKLSLESLPFDLEDLLDELTELLATRVEEKGLELCVDLDPSASGEFVGDPLRLKQVLINLLGNAIKFSEQGTLTLAVAQQSVGAGGVVLHFRVSDEGIGISPEQQAALFCPFGQADGSTTRRLRRFGAGADDQQAPGRIHGRADLAGKPARRGQHLPLHGPPRRRIQPQHRVRRPAATAGRDPRAAGRGQSPAGRGDRPPVRRARSDGRLPRVGRGRDGGARSRARRLRGGACRLAAGRRVRRPHCARAAPAGGRPSADAAADAAFGQPGRIGAGGRHRAPGQTLRNAPPAPGAGRHHRRRTAGSARGACAGRSRFRRRRPPAGRGSAGCRRQRTESRTGRRPAGDCGSARPPGGRRRAGGCRGARTAARRGADGLPDAGHGRPGGDPRAAHAPGTRRPADHRADRRGAQRGPRTLLAAGMDAFVTKPVHLDTLLRTLGGLVRRTVPAVAIPPSPAVERSRRPGRGGAAARAARRRRRRRPGGGARQGRAVPPAAGPLPRQLRRRVRRRFEAALAVDRATALRLAHTLKGLARNLGIRGLGDLA